MKLHLGRHISVYNLKAVRQHIPKNVGFIMSYLPNYIMVILYHKCSDPRFHKAWQYKMHLSYSTKDIKINYKRIVMYRCKYKKGSIKVKLY